MLTRGSCNLTGEFPKFPYLVLFQQQISYVPVSALAQLDMADPQPWHSLAGTAAQSNGPTLILVLISECRDLAQPGLTPDPALM